ncbi:PfkB family carbohydrate kinase [Gottfriedia sp. NPDC058432]|uniref:PfkB family carbohydrate kinase n=1 Tax=Gottfriedia sp. NPDC058432 TaxID=3346497 RepID=UPI003648A4F8
MKYIIVGPTIVNDIQFADGSISKGQIGGAIFCLEGVKIWSDDCLYVSNVGEDFSKYYGEWMDANHCSYEGLNYNLPYTEYTNLIYGDEGLHDEVSIYSEDIEKKISEIDIRTAEQIAIHCGSETRGIYIEASEVDPLWDNLHLIHMNCNAKIMWEIPTSAAMQKHRNEKVLKTIIKAGLYSINLPEAMRLFETKDEKSTIEAIISFGVPCFFRVGSRGSYMISDGQAYFAPSITVGDVVDATGCGNCSTAAALYAYCEGYAPKKVAAMANIAAAYNLLQFGPYPVITSETRAEAMRLLEK